jgi:glycosyltransferase involved in cell wall biosynthesis
MAQRGVDEDRAKLRVAHVNAGYWPATYYGGPTFSSYQLCNGLVRQGCDVRVLTTDVNGPGSRLSVQLNEETMLEGVHVRYTHSILDTPLAPSLFRYLPELLGWADIVHLTGVYSFHVIPTLAACKSLALPMVWSPRGSLQRWGDERKLALKAAWEQVCRAALPHRCALHVTAPPEAEASRKRMGVSSLRLAQVPNGVEVPTEPPEPLAFSPDQELKLLFIGRLMPIKGIENLIDACGLLKTKGQKLRLVIAGSTADDAYRVELAERVKKNQLDGEVRFAGEVRGDEKRAAFGDCHIVVVPSHIENFGLVVAEGLAHQRPVVVSRHAPWPELESKGCGLWVDNDSGSLAQAIAELRDRPLDEMGRRGYAWMRESFSWDGVARQMIAAYRKLLQQPSG